MKDCPIKAVIYLKCKPEICKTRIQKRNREGEADISVDYLKDVHKKHEDWIERLTGI